MSQEMDRQEMAIRYLLGALAEEEQTRLEEQYFLDDKQFEQFEIAEDELIDRYVRNELSAEDATRFEKLLASPRIAERVEVARILKQRTASLPRPEPARVVTADVKPAPLGWWERIFGPAAAAPAFRPAFAMALIFMLLTTVTLIFVWSKLQAESNRLAQEQQQREALERQIAEQKASYETQITQTRQEKEEQQQLVERYKQLLTEQQQKPTQALIIPLLLNPGGGTRGGGSAVQPISIPRGVKSVGIGLNVTHGDYSSYTAVVRNIDSAKEITKRANLKPSQQQGRKYISFNVNATSLTPGSYSIHVDGITPDGSPENFDDYTFRVTSR